MTVVSSLMRVVTPEHHASNTYLKEVNVEVEMQRIPPQADMDVPT